MASPVTGLGVHIKVSDISASRDFYEGYLGLEPSFAYGDDAFRASVPDGVPTVGERYRGLTYAIPGGARIEIADGHIAVDQEVFGAPVATPKVSAMISVTSLVPLLEQSKHRSKHGVRHYYWDTLEMVVRDPDGWVIVLIAPYSEEEERAVSNYIAVEKVDPQPT